MLTILLILRSLTSLQMAGILLIMWYEWNGCCSSAYNRDRINEILEDLGCGSDTYVVSSSYENNSATGY